jgi:hypothetical protein
MENDFFIERCTDIIFSIMSMQAIAPMSEVFETLKTFSGQNRVVVDTDSKPWNYLVELDSSVNKVTRSVSVCNTMAALQEFRKKNLPGITEEEFLNSSEMLLNAYYVTKNIDDIYADAVHDEDSISVLWEKVARIESVLTEFMRFTFFLDECIIPLQKKGQVTVLHKFYHLFEFVKAHTKGSMHVSAAKLLFEITLVNPVDAPRRWKCSICYERGRKAHSCIRKQCGHVFHIECDLNVHSPECPMCRSIEDL